MQISMWSSYLFEMSAEKMVKTMLAHGFNCTELSDEHAKELLDRGPVAKVGKEFKKFCDNQGFSLPQGHLYLDANIAHPDIVKRTKILDELKYWCELFNILDIKAGVLHPGGNGWSADSEQEQIEEVIIESLATINSYVDNTPLIICLENTCSKELIGLGQNVKELLRFIKPFSPNNFGICLDTGHLALTKESCAEFIRKAGTNLKALHIADNMGKEDNHIFPYSSGMVSWDEVISALKEINYNGLFNFEVPGERCPQPISMDKLDYAQKLGTWMCRNL
jgi:sugar phosphate isomerase/epimerase